MELPRIIGTWLLVLGAALLCSSCLRPDASQQLSQSGGTGVQAQLSESPKADVKRKRAQQLNNGIAKILGLSPQGQCLELGLMPCADLVHRVSLGGMNAYGMAQYTYPKHASISSVMATDRLVLSACLQRAQLDLINPKQGVIFRDIELSPDMRLVKNEAVTQAVQRLYQRSLLRDASPEEVTALLELYESIYAKEPLGAARNWMVLSCYTVLTSAEFVFY